MFTETKKITTNTIHLGILDWYCVSANEHYRITESIETNKNRRVKK